MCAIGFTIPVTCWTVCMTPIIQEVGITHTQASMYMMAATLFSVVSLVLAPKIIKVGAGKMIAIAGVVSACVILVPFAYLGVKRAFLASSGSPSS